MDKFIKWITSIPKNIIAFLLKTFTFIVSLFFVKLNLSTADNVTSGNKFNSILSDILEPHKIEFLSRCSEVNSSRQIKHSNGFYTCFNKYLYFISVEYGDLMSSGEPDERNIYDVNEDIYITKTARIYVPFWRMKKIEKTISDIDTPEKPIIHMQRYLYGDVDYKEIVDRDLSRYNAEDVQRVFDKLDEKFKEYNHFNSYVSIYSEEAHLFVEDYAKRNDMNIFLYVHSSSFYYDACNMIFRFRKFLEQNKGKDIIFFINCNDHSELFDVYGNRCNFNRMYDGAYRHIMNNLVHYIASDVKCVFVLDSKYHKRTKSRNIVFDEIVELDDTTSVNLTKIYNQSDKLIVREIDD